MVNRTQALVLGFTVLALVSLVGTLVAAPEVYDRAMRPPSRDGPLEIAFLVALAAFIALLGVGVLRRWRWTFWLVMVAGYRRAGVWGAFQPFPRRVGRR